MRKAVIPAAGLGTRFLPATKAIPKEMLPVLDKPAIQYVVEEAVRAGLTDIVMITGRNKRPLEDHFDREPFLEHTLEGKGDRSKLVSVRASSTLADIHYLRQGDPLGLGHAVLRARKHIGNEPFAVLLGDDLIDEHDEILREMALVQELTGSSVIALMEVDPSQISAYGCADAVRDDSGRLRVRKLVEKPEPAAAPSSSRDRQVRATPPHLRRPSRDRCRQRRRDSTHRRAADPGGCRGTGFRCIRCALHRQAL
jgi:UTP--glucose-1-phosphate uridylyltransferase